MKFRVVLVVCVLVLVVFLILAGCSAAPTATPIGKYVSPEQGTTLPRVPILQRIHDDEMSVTCWVFSDPYRGGISCLPDQQIGAK